MSHSKQQAYEYTHDAIARAILYKRSMLISLLQDNGVSVSPMISNADLTTAVLTALGNSPRFQNAILPLLQEVKITQHVQEGTFQQDRAKAHEITLDHFTRPNYKNATGEPFSGFSGERTFGYCGEILDDGTVDDASCMDGSTSTSTTPTPAAPASTDPAVVAQSGGAPSGGSSFLGSVFNAGFVQSLLKTGIGVVAAKVGGSTNQGLAKSAAQIEAEKTKQVQAQAALAAKGIKPVGTTTTMSTGTKIAIGVGAAVIVGLAIYAIAEKK